MPETEDTRPDLKWIEPLNTTAIEAEAEQWAADQIQFAGQVAAQLKTAADLVNEQDILEETYRFERDQVALAIMHYYQVRHGASMHRAVGVNRSRWSVMMKSEAANRRHLRKHADPELLVRLAASTYRARMRAQAAREYRDEMVCLLAGEMSNVEIAALIGRNPSQVSHIKYRDSEPAA